MKLVSVEQVRERANVRDGDAFDLAISSIIEQTSMELANFLRTDRFDQVAHTDIFYTDSSNQSIRTSRPYIELSLKNGFVVQPPAIAIKWHANYQDLAADGNVLDPTAYVVMEEVGLIRITQEWVVNSYYQVEYTAGFVIDSDSDFGDIVQDPEDVLPFWLLNAAIQFATERIKLDQDDKATTKKKQNVPLIPLSVTQNLGHRIRSHGYAIKAL